MVVFRWYKYLIKKVRRYGARKLYLNKMYFEYKFRNEQIINACFEWNLFVKNM